VVLRAVAWTTIPTTGFLSLFARHRLAGIRNHVGRTFRRFFRLRLPTLHLVASSPRRIACCSANDHPRACLMIDVGSSGFGGGVCPAMRDTKKGQTLAEAAERWQGGAYADDSCYGTCRSRDRREDCSANVARPNATC
jgi:hypothetical protein